MKNKSLKNCILAAMFLGLGLVLPFLTGQIREIGNKLLPMHIPVFLCGLICGWQYGLTVGFICPILRSFVFGMPQLYPMAVAMAFELATYGFLAGLLYSHAGWHCIKTLYRSLILSMLGGRCVWGIVQTILLGVGGKGFTFAAFIAGAFTNAILGVVLQLVLIPAVMVAFNRAKLVPIYKKEKNQSETK